MSFCILVCAFKLCMTWQSWILTSTSFLCFPNSFLSKHHYVVVFFFHYVVLIGVPRNKNILCSGNIILTSNKVNRFFFFFTVSLFRTVNIPMCCKDPKTRKDVVMMETAWGLAWENRKVGGHGDHTEAHCANSGLLLCNWKGQTATVFKLKKKFLFKKHNRNIFPVYKPDCWFASYASCSVGSGVY